MCPLCDDTREVAYGDLRVACPFHGTAVLVGAQLDPVVSDRIRANLMDHARQHQFEPAGLTTPNRHQIPVPDRPPAPKQHPGWGALGALLCAVSAGAVVYAVIHLIGALFS